MHINPRHRMLIILMIRQSSYYKQRWHYLANLAIHFCSIADPSFTFFTGWKGRDKFDASRGRYYLSWCVRNVKNLNLKNCNFLQELLPSKEFDSTNYKVIWTPLFVHISDVLYEIKDDNCNKVHY